jgi:hypothetical protein
LQKSAADNFDQDRTMRFQASNSTILEQEVFSDNFGDHNLGWPQLWP